MARERGRTMLAGLVVALAIAALPLGGCGDDESPADAGANGATGAFGASVGGDEAAQLLRPGCGPYCQQAGGFGGGSEAEPILAITPEATALDDGTVPIEIECRFELGCEGAILVTLEGDPADFARMDLALAPGQSAAHAVSLPPPLAARLDRGEELRLVVTADGFPSVQRLPVEERDEVGGVVGQIVTVRAAS